MGGGLQVSIVIFKMAILLALVCVQNHAIYVKKQLNLSCYNCDRYGAWDGTEPCDLPEDNNLTMEYGEGVAKRCFACAIQEHWRNGEINRYSRQCLVSNATSNCSYDYTISAKYTVIQTCRCYTDFCNVANITSIGGFNDTSFFSTTKDYGGLSASSSLSPLAIFTCGFCLLLLVSRSLFT